MEPSTPPATTVGVNGAQSSEKLTNHQHHVPPPRRGQSARGSASGCPRPRGSRLQEGVKVGVGACPSLWGRARGSPCPTGGADCRLGSSDTCRTLFARPGGEQPLTACHESLTARCQTSSYKDVAGITG